MIFTKIWGEDVEIRFHTSYYELDRLFPKGKNKKVIVLIGLNRKAYGYLIADRSKNKKAKDRKKCFINRKLKFENYKNCLEATQLDNKIKYLEKIKLT